MKYEDRHDLFPDTVIISYPFRWGGQRGDVWMWMAEMNGEVLDYHSKDTLIINAILANEKYVVLRVHKDKDMTITVVEHNEN